MDDEPLNLNWKRGDCTVTWQWKGQSIIRSYDFPVPSAAVLGTPPVIVIVEPWQLSGPNNAVIFDLDGVERLRLIPPQVEYPLGFSQVFQSSAVIEAVFSGRFRDLHGEPDFDTGEIRNVREWR